MNNELKEACKTIAEFLIKPITFLSGLVCRFRGHRFSFGYIYSHVHRGTDGKVYFCCCGKKLGGDSGYRMNYVRDRFI